jgi:predicted esterase
MSTRYLLFNFLLLIAQYNQSPNQIEQLPASLIPQALQAIKLDNRITADSACRELSRWNTFPSIPATGRQYLFYFRDSLFGQIPFRVYVPETYKNTRRTPLLLLLHGAVGASSFDDAKDYLNPSSAVAKDDAEDPLFNFLSKKDYIIVRPIADPKMKFDWVINQFGGFGSIKPATNNGVNATYKALARMISLIKASFNVDDDRVYAMGHSDGADGTFCLGLMQPGQFGGFVIYNSMLTNLNARNIFLKNLSNISLYAVHSDLDNLRPIQKTREVIREANQILERKIIYKEYNGYQHFDKHLSMDVPYAAAFLDSVRRDSYPSDIYWESDNATDNRYAWLCVDKFDLKAPKADWQTELNPISFDKRSGTYGPEYCYSYNNQSYAIRGHYSNNTFTIFSSRVQSFKIYIDPSRVNINRPVVIFVNGKRLFHSLVLPDKTFLLNTFGDNFDRTSIWIAEVSIEVPLA